MNGFVFFVLLLAWTSAGQTTPDSGMRSASTLDGCHLKSLAFARKHETPIQLCQKITSKKYAILTSGDVSFVHSDKKMPEVAPYVDPEIVKLRKALRAIGKWHREKTKDSQRVRAIIRSVLK